MRAVEGMAVPASEWRVKQVRVESVGRGLTAERAQYFKLPTMDHESALATDAARREFHVLLK